jgi:hypothetical protein
MTTDDVSALGHKTAETRGEGTTVSDIDVMRLAVEGLADCAPRARLAAVDWLHQRVRSDVRQELAATVAVCSFFREGRWFYPRSPVVASGKR